MAEPDKKLTRLLGAIESGDSQAAADLLPLVYDGLRRVAAVRLASEPPAQTLQATALVHEAWLRLVASERQNWRSRAYFFAAAAEAMRRILVERARRRQQVRRGGGWQRVDLDRLDLPQTLPEEKLLLVDEALEELARLDPIEAQVVKLHYFAGLSHAESAEVLGISERTVKRYWAFAKAWLYARIRAGPGG